VEPHAGPPADCDGPPLRLSAMLEAIKRMTRGAPTTNQRAHFRRTVGVQQLKPIAWQHGMATWTGLEDGHEVADAPGEDTRRATAQCPEKARSRSGHALVASWSCTGSFDDHAHATRTFARCSCGGIPSGRSRHCRSADFLTFPGAKTLPKTSTSFCLKSL